MQHHSLSALRFVILLGCISLFADVTYGGKKLWSETDGVIVKLAVAPSNSQILYAANEKNQVFQSQDAGKTWKILS